ncbi:MAG TPA: hypothetical protein VNZ86_03215 [Bacteroidia bacterium]|jgi:hypothetical protein|nr:hypothetical protein [Bacteroidia bacterium]
MDSTSSVTLDMDTTGPDFDAAMDELSKTTGWMKFLAILGFIGAGFIALAGLFALVIPRGVGVIALVVCLVIAVLIFIPCRFLYKYAQGVQEYRMSQSSSVLDQALGFHKSFWVFMGVMYCILLAFGILAMILGSGSSSNIFSSF